LPWIVNVCNREVKDDIPLAGADKWIADSTISNDEVTQHDIHDDFEYDKYI